MTSTNIRPIYFADNHPALLGHHLYKVASRRAGRSGAVGAAILPGDASGHSLLPAFGIALLTLVMIGALVIPH